MSLTSAWRLQALPCHKTLTPPEGDQHKPVRVNVSSTAGKCAPMKVIQPEHGESP